MICCYAREELSITWFYAVNNEMATDYHVNVTMQMSTQKWHLDHRAIDKMEEY